MTVRELINAIYASGAKMDDKIQIEKINDSFTTSDIISVYKDITGEILISDI